MSMPASRLLHLADDGASSGSDDSSSSGDGGDSGDSSSSDESGSDEDTSSSGECNELLKGVAVYVLQVK